MAELTLGLDLGPSSIGWALLDEQAGRVVGAGVRVFPEGVDRDTKGGEVSKNEQRRLARATRRQQRRRAARKRRLRRALVEAGLLPKVALLDRNDPQRIAWERDTFREADPYELRRKALHEKLDPHEIGRVLLHLAQRRGFLSNRKTDRDPETQKENRGVLQEISDLAEAMDGQTLGQHLAAERGSDPQRFHQTRLRGKHTHRSMLEDEFEAIWEAQRPHYPELLTDVLKHGSEGRQAIPARPATAPEGSLLERFGLHGLIFFQRELLPPSPSLVGRCELNCPPAHAADVSDQKRRESLHTKCRLPRAPRADRRVQRFRLYQQVNNLRVIDLSANTEWSLVEDEEKREKLVKYLWTKKEATFDAIRKHLFEQYESIRFNLERGGRKKLEGMRTDASLASKKLIGPAWRKVPEELRDRIVAAIIDDAEQRLRHLLAEAELDADLAELLLERTDLEQGYSSYSLYAIKRLLPSVERGLPLTSRSPDQPCALREAGYLMPWEHAPDQTPLLPDPPKVTNPLVSQALHEVRKVVNALLRELVHRPGHRLAKVRIELAREMRGTAAQREKRTAEMRKNEQRREQAADRIREYAQEYPDLGIRPNASTIRRYLLWEEQEGICIYSGSPISIRQLFSGEVDVDHILPRQRSLDDSMMNKVVCFRRENALGADRYGKGDRTPYEWLAESQPQKYEQVLQRARCFLPNAYPKYKRFLQESVSLDDFFARQFVDTTYITTQVHQYLKCLGADVLCIKGQHTSTLRHHWGLETVLAELEDSPAWEQALELPPGQKNRLDHRHHAIDAIVVALTDRPRLQQLAGVRRRRGTEATGEILPEPDWTDFRKQVIEAVRAIHVSHRPRRRVSGRLHEDTIYGPTDKPGELVVRKDLTALTCSMVQDIRDPVVREKVLGRLREHGIEPGRGRDKIPSEVWNEPLWMNEEKGVAIKRVRLIRREQSIVPIRNGTAYVKPGRLHHACVFEVPGRNGQPRREAVYVSLLEAKRRIKRREPVVQREHPEQPNARFLMSVSPGDMLLAEFQGRERLVVVSTLVSTQKRIHIVDANDARPGAQRKDEGKRANTLVARKVTVDPIGRIRWAERKHWAANEDEASTSR